MMLTAPGAEIIILFAWLSPSYALYFHIGETEKKCFIEEIPDETMVIGKLASYVFFSVSYSWLTLAS